MINEDQLEQLAIQWFQDTGWSYLPGKDIAPDSEAPERSDFREVVLQGRLTSAIARLNPGLSPSAVAEVVQTATKLPEPTVAQNNRVFHRLLTQGVPVTYTNTDDELEHDHARLIDFQNPAHNDLLVVSQFTITGTKQPRRPDLVVFINGLPLAVVELKNPADENADIWKAYHQIETYKNEIGDLFHFNEALIISDGSNARLGSLTATAERFMPWRTIENEDDKPKLEFQLETLIRGFFRPDFLLDYLRYFVLFEQDSDRLIKKIAGYHQFHGVRAAVRTTLIAAKEEAKDGQVKEPRAPYGQEVVPGSKKAGVFWHTQGSGKSISMACYAGMLLQQPEMNNPTLVVVTDRNDLDGQLFQQFCSAQDLLKQTPEQADSRDELREKLASRQSGGIIFTTVQKFSLPEGETSHPELCARHNVVVISDEAHRSQYGLTARLDKKTGTYKFGYAKHMRDALPNASFIGFTGTPIALEDKDTRGTFGDYVSIYDIQDAVDDGATVEIFYESRLAKLDINRAEIEALNKEVEEIMEDEEDTASREKAKGKWTQLAKLVGAEPRIKEVAADLVQHFETRNEAMEGKAMIVCMSREICVSLFNELMALRPDWAGSRREKNGKNSGYDPEDGAVRIVMTGTASDRKELQDHVFTKQEKKRLEKRFKDANDPLKLVIVRDMWLTGFDAPCCHTMYVDKPMKGHNLAQSIARVNRVFKDKPGGLVVDYIGIAGDLKRAVKTYTDAKGKGQPTVQAEDALAILLEKIDIVRGLYHGFDYSAYATDPLSILCEAANHLLGLPDGKKRYADVMASVSKAYSLCSTLDEAAALREEIAFFNAVKAIIVKDGTTPKKIAKENKDSVLRQILNNAVLSEGVVDVFNLAGLDKPNIGLLSDDFLEDVKNLKTQNLAVELLQRLLQDKIRANTRTNVVQEKKYSDRLLETLRQYNNRAIETAQVIEELIQMAKDLQAAMQRDEELGLAPDEIAFYDALAEKPEVLKAMGDETLKSLATELTEKLRASTTVDWQVRDSVRAKMRLLVKRLLRKYKYPPEGQEEAIARVVEQAEVLADSWT
ncbi:type I restriction endonuclease subunit R [Roseibacillus ishigakijimensis]|uniref:Type I restriction enzyme endonuclease subunit n=1 Tax=Roseibacillus ishigakijimensis TaxID=454146 RepID=A0A934VHX1_9BACT|nr:type I restriction endonuclease subunit R [Roseibacillus ishigakijimensis]MBK1834438.1 type I restriction endonuclease subunit R [Roseibacillus ishigakijimensis]